jgi:nucleotide-binding universal stress UspA family protein
MKAKRVLVPLDGSRVAEAALPFALDLAAHPGGMVLLLYVQEARGPAPEPGPVLRDAARDGEVYLGEIAGRLRRDGAAGVSICVWRGSPAHAIVTAAKQYGADVIVLTTHGRTGLARECFGSVAESVLRGTGLPVLVVRADATPYRAPLGEASPVSTQGM